MKGVILAAGNGIRLRPITETRPKPLIPVLCRPLISWHVDAMLRAGVEEILVVVHYMSEMIEERLSREFPRANIKYVRQEEPRGTGDAVLRALEYAKEGDELIIAYSDIFVKDWGIYSKLKEAGGPAVVGARVSDPRHYGVLVVDGGRLSHIVEKPQDPVPGLANAGIYKLRASDILENKDVGLSPRGELEFTDIVSRIAAKKEVKVLALAEGEWIDVGKPWHVIDANKMALSLLRGEIRGRIVGPVHITGEVYIDETAEILPFTTIEGPAYIGRNARIGPNARVRPWTVICDNSVVGFSVEVKESVLFENVYAHHLSYIGDSVICEGVNFGAGTITANLRFDERNVKMMVKDKLEDTGRKKLGAIVGGGVKTGVNVSIMPGVKIGSGSWIMPGTVVYRDVPPKSIYPGKAYEISGGKSPKTDER